MRRRVVRQRAVAVLMVLRVLRVLRGRVDRVPVLRW